MNGSGTITTGEVECNRLFAADNKQRAAGADPIVNGPLSVANRAWSMGLKFRISKFEIKSRQSTKFLVV